MKKFLIFIIGLATAAGSFSGCQKENGKQEVAKESNEELEISVESIDNPQLAKLSKVPPVDPRDRITVNLPSNPRGDLNLSGVYSADKGENIYFRHTFKNGKIYLTFLSEDQNSIIEMVRWEDEEYTSRIIFKFADTEIEFDEISGLELNSTQEEKLKEFGKSVYAEALANVSAYSYWKMPGQDYNDFRLSFMTMYYYLVPYIAPERKLFTQPSNTTSGNCMLDECQLWHNEGIFGCKDGIDYMPLLDGPPSECVLVENHKIPR